MILEYILARDSAILSLGTDTLISAINKATVVNRNPIKQPNTELIILIIGILIQKHMQHLLSAHAVTARCKLRGEHLVG